MAVQPVPKSIVTERLTLISCAAAPDWSAMYSASMLPSASACTQPELYPSGSPGRHVDAAFMVSLTTGPDARMILDPSVGSTNATS